MRVLTVLLALVSALITSSVTKAQLDPPPKITVVGAERVVRVSVGTESNFDLVENTNEEAGPFLDDLTTSDSGNLGSRGFAQAGHKTDISSFSVRGAGTVDATGILGGGEDALIDVKSRSDMTVVFTVPINAPYTLSANFEAEGEDVVCLSHALVSFAGVDENG